MAEAIATLPGVSVARVDTFLCSDPGHYITLDYAPAAQITAKGSGTAYTTLNGATGLATLQNATSTAPAYIANTLMNNPAAPVKVFCPVRVTVPAASSHRPGGGSGW